MFYTTTHPLSPCKPDCYERFNPENLSYLVVRNGAGWKHHTGPHAREAAAHQAADILAIETELGTPSWSSPLRSIVVEEHRWDPKGGYDGRGTYVRTYNDVRLNVTGIG